MTVNAREEQNSVSTGKANLPTIFIVDTKFVVSNPRKIHENKKTH